MFNFSSSLLLKISDPHLHVFLVLFWKAQTEMDMFYFRLVWRLAAGGAGGRQSVSQAVKVKAETTEPKTQPLLDQLQWTNPPEKKKEKQTWRGRRQEKKTKVEKKNASALNFVKPISAKNYLPVLTFFNFLFFCRCTREKPPKDTKLKEMWSYRLGSTRLQDPL